MFSGVWSRRRLAVFVCSILLGVVQYAHAMPDRAVFYGSVQTVDMGNVTLSSPSGLVLDTQGNVFIADTGNSRIVEVDAQGVASVLTISGLSPALATPVGMAIDGSGNLYVADTGNNRIVKISSSGAGSVIDTGSGLG